MAKKREKTEAETALEEIRARLSEIQKDRDEIFMLIHKYQLDVNIAIDKINHLLSTIKQQKALRVRHRPERDIEIRE